MLKKGNSDFEEISLDYRNRIITTGENYAYLKIAEGCSNYCTYCAIPYIQGKYYSRPKEEILEEAKILAQKGIKEIIVIAQDTGRYGEDLYGKQILPELLKELCQIQGIKWIRFLYTYPETITKELIEVVKEEPKICKYFDIPIQHIADQVLKKMNRKTTGQKITQTINKIRREIPEVTLRTSLIVGFPQETEEEYQELYNFVKETKFDKLGVFEYSREEGTPAARLPHQVHHQIKKRRKKQIMELQAKISARNLEAKIGREYEALIEGQTRDGKYYIRQNANGCPRRRWHNLHKNKQTT